MSKQILDNLIKRYPNLESIKNNINECYFTLKDAFVKQNILFICGNGGSASDSEHIVGELMKGFLLNRKTKLDFQKKFIEKYGDEGKIFNLLQGGLKAISLTSHQSLNTAFSNDVSSELVFAQQLFVLGGKDDVLFAITTSGNSKNVLRAVQVAKVLGMKVILLTGNKYDGGKCGELADVTIMVPEEETYIVQEYHLPIYHAICAMLEDNFFGQNED